MSLPHKAALKAATPSGASTATGALGPPPTATGPPAPPAAPSSAAAHPGIRALPPPAALSRGALPQSLDERIFPTVYSTVAAQVARQPGPPAPSPYSAHDLTKGHPNLAATPPGHASSPGLSQASYATGQNASAPTLVYPQPPQTMTTQPQTRSPFAAGPRPTHHQFFQRPQIQPPRAAIQNSNPSIRAGAQTPTAVYQTNQHIMMVNHAIPMPYAMPQGPQYCIPQYRHSAPPYVGPQQYPVQPPGPSPFYPGPGPGDFPTPYGTPFYPSQPVYQSAPIPIVPPQQPQQPPPPAKREKKTIRIRDPNQGGRDITEEIMSGGGSRNPTPPILRPSSTPTPPQLPSQVPEHSPVVYGTVEGPHLTAIRDPKIEEKPKLDPVLKSSPSAPVRPEPPAPGKCATPEQIPEPAAPEAASEHRLPPGISPVLAAVTAPVLVATTQAFPCHLTDTSEGDSPVEECASPDEAVAEDAEEGLCKDPLGPTVAAETPVTAQEMNGISYEHSTGDSAVGEKAMLGEETPPDVPELAPPVDASVECASPNVPQTTPVQPESPPPPLIAAAQCTTKTSPPVAVLPAVASDHVDDDDEEDHDDDDDDDYVRTPSSDGAPDSANTRPADTDTELEPSVTLLSFTSRKSPVEAQTAPAAPKMWQKPKDESPHGDEVPPASVEPQGQDDAEEKGEETESEDGGGVSAEVDHPYLNSKLPEENGEAEPLRNGADTVSEDSGGDVPLGPEEGYPYKSGVPMADQPADMSQDAPAVPASYVPHDGKRQYDRDFLLGFQFMPACVQKPEGLPPISDVVLDKVRREGGV